MTPRAEKPTVNFIFSYTVIGKSSHNTTKIQNTGIPMSAALAIGTKTFYMKIAQSSLLAGFLYFCLPRMQSYVSNYIFRLWEKTKIWNWVLYL